MAYDISAFTLADMALCGAELRRLSEGAASMEDVAERTVAYLHQSLLDGKTGENAMALVRLFQTQQYEDLDAALKQFAARLGGDNPIPADASCLVLSATAGSEKEWSSRAASRGHQAIPLLSEQAVEQIPMIATLIKQFGLDTGSVLRPTRELIADLSQRTFNVFHVGQARNNPYIPSQKEFVAPYGIESCLGFGGMMPSGRLFAVIMFSRVPISRDTANLFKSLSLSVKLGLLPFDAEIPFRLHPSRERERDAVESPSRDTGRELRALRAKLPALEELLEVQEQTVTEQSQRLYEALQELGRQERFKHAILSSLDEHIAVIGEGGAVLEANDAWTRFAKEQGRSTLAHIGVGADYIASIAQKAAAGDPTARAALTGLQAVAGGSQISFSFEYTGSTPGGQRWFELCVTRLEGSTSAVVAHRDITPQKEMESRLQHAQKLESIGQLAAGVAHEINTPTQFVGDNTRFLRDSFGQLMELSRRLEELCRNAAEGGDRERTLADLEEAKAEADLDFLAEEVPKAIDQSMDGLERIARIVRSMKDFAHPGHKEKAMADLNRAIESTATVSRNEWKYVADLELELDPNLPLVHCIVSEINQVILNLIVNAAHAIADATADGAAETGRIVIRTRQIGEAVEVRVHDTGCGMPEEVVKRVFEPFFTTKEVGRGTGRGLSIAHRVVVTEHGGAIDVESEVGRGATFVLKLPIGSMPEAAKRP